MGRNVAMGIACKISVHKENYTTKERFLELNSQIKENIEKHIDVSHYKVIETDEKITYKIDESFVNEHIHELVKEVNHLLDMKNYFLYNSWYNDYQNIDLNSDKFNQKNYPFELKWFDENYNYESEYEKKYLCNDYGVRTGDKEEYTYLTGPFYPENVWMIHGESELLRNVNIYASYVELWIDENKIDGEDESKIIQLLNIFSRNYFKNPLGKDIHFYIFG